MKIIPDKFPRDPLGWAGNQAGHTMIGAMFAFDFCMVFHAVAGEYPFKSTLFAVLVLVYLIFVELKGQGWKGIDTVEDTAFVASGGAMILFPFSEITPGVFETSVSPEAFGMIALAWQAYMAGGMAGRYWARLRSAGDA